MTGPLTQQLRRQLIVKKTVCTVLRGTVKKCGPGPQSAHTSQTLEMSLHFSEPCFFLCKKGHFKRFS